MKIILKIIMINKYNQMVNIMLKKLYCYKMILKVFQKKKIIINKKNNPKTI